MAGPERKATSMNLGLHCLCIRVAGSSSLFLDERDVMAVYMLDYYLPMLSPNEGYNETGLTMQSAGPIRQPWQPIAFEFLFKGSEFGHWRVKGGQDAFAFRHPSLGQSEVFSLMHTTTKLAL